MSLTYEGWKKSVINKIVAYINSDIFTYYQNFKKDYIDIPVYSRFYKQLYKGVSSELLIEIYSMLSKYRYREYVKKAKSVFEIGAYSYNSYNMRLFMTDTMRKFIIKEYEKTIDMADYKEWKARTTEYIKGITPVKSGVNIVITVTSHTKFSEHWYVDDYIPLYILTSNVLDYVLSSHNRLVFKKMEELYQLKIAELIK